MHARLLTGGLSLVEQLCALVSMVFFLDADAWSVCLTGSFEIYHIRSAEQHADFLIKPLHAETFRFC